METVKDFLSKKIYDSHGIEISVDTVLILVVTLILTHLILRLIRNIASRRLEDDDRNRFKTVFTFLKYIKPMIKLLLTL